MLGFGCVFMVGTSFWLSLEQGSPLVFLSTHKSLLDGFLLPFVLFSQGLGVVRVALDPCTCSPALRYDRREVPGWSRRVEVNSPS